MAKIILDCSPELRIVNGKGGGNVGCGDNVGFNVGDNVGTAWLRQYPLIWPPYAPLQQAIIVEKIGDLTAWGVC